MSEARTMGLYNYKKGKFLFVLLPLSIIKLYIDILVITLQNENHIA